MKKKPEQSGIEWRKIKLIKNGANGIKSDFGYLESHKGIANHVNFDGASKDVPPHDCFLKLFKRLNVIAATLDGIDYAKKILNISSFAATEEQKNIINGAVSEAVGAVEVTGLNIYKKKDSKQVILSYNKTDEEGEVTGHSTSKLSLEFQKYGIEDLLEEIVGEIEVEAYRYFYDNVYADMEQTTIFDKDDENLDDVEEANVVED